MSWENQYTGFIYFSSVPAFFGKSLGKTCRGPTNPASWTFQRSNIDRSKPLSYLGPEYEKVVVVDVPALDVALPTKPDPHAAPFPSLLSSPLIKTHNGPNVIQGWASGIRSGLLQLESGEWVRLKGTSSAFTGILIADSS